METKCNNGYTDSLRGYGRKVFKEYGYKCVYCERDFSSKEMWLFLTVEHVILLSMERGLEGQSWFNNNPKILRRNLVNLRPACRFCNGLKNKDSYSDYLVKDSFENSVRKVLDIKKEMIGKKRGEYLEFYQNCVTQDMRTMGRF
jgi:5-methylcytosine-specific restriction endonuclease McrA